LSTKWSSLVIKLKKPEDMLTKRLGKVFLHSLDLSLFTFKRLEEGQARVAGDFTHKFALLEEIEPLYVLLVGVEPLFGGGNVKYFGGQVVGDWWGSYVGDMLALIEDHDWCSCKTLLAAGVQYSKREYKLKIQPGGGKGNKVIFAAIASHAHFLACTKGYGYRRDMGTTLIKRCAAPQRPAAAVSSERKRAKMWAIG
jgi:hypothetical protein